MAGDARLRGLALSRDPEGASANEQRVDSALDVHVLGEGQQCQRTHRAARRDEGDGTRLHGTPDQGADREPRLGVGDGAQLGVGDVRVVEHATDVHLGVTDGDSDGEEPVRRPAGDRDNSGGEDAHGSRRGAERHHPDREGYQNSRDDGEQPRHHTIPNDDLCHVSSVGIRGGVRDDYG